MFDNKFKIVYVTSVSRQTLNNKNKFEVLSCGVVVDYTHNIKR